MLATTVEAMVALGADYARIAAAIGPTIAQPSYEVGEAFFEAFCDDDTGNARFFTPGTPGHYQFDLPAFVTRQLRNAGVSTIENLALDTYADPARFYSFRRATHRGEATYGRQGAFICVD